ncbi:MAG: hypothetical protein D6722_22015 [Bacteroidetes bacterium]|nr:MAG: hypothetical protein D6722_22015 [Bacteroidota bacterium]
MEPIIRLLGPQSLAIDMRPPLSPPHPNPTPGRISWDFDAPYTGTVAVWSLTGQRLETASVAGRTRVEIDLQAYPPGLYLLRREDGQVAKVLRE